MISFTLRCENDHAFEIWFKNSQSLETQLLRHLIECPSCGTNTIGKALSTPNIATSRKKDAARDEVVASIKEDIQQLRETIETKCENVGDNFAEEARKIHYGETEERAIYGKTTTNDAKALKDEGIEFASLPWDDDDKKVN